ncbi:unnamed protein product, partial [Mesorhabditis belari]|uniref:Probable oligoribonuclease n=1 Tax=Mesorhabditis belari TaxID=2138241 RepID=A0AAF3FMU5_9BILA
MTQQKATTTNLPTSKQGRLVWIDCEMTGLDWDVHTLVEIAVIVTDQELKIIAEGPDIVIHQTEDVLKKMNEWCRKTFPENGLLQQIRKSQISMEEAEAQILSFLEPLVEKGTAPIAGNTVWMDRVFIKKYMPRLDEYLHYRVLDVTAVYQISSLWYPEEHKSVPKKRRLHRALSDIRESINMLKSLNMNAEYAQTLPRVTDAKQVDEQRIWPYYCWEIRSSNAYPLVELIFLF